MRWSITRTTYGTPRAPSTTFLHGHGLTALSLSFRSFVECISDLVHHATESTMVATTRSGTQCLCAFDLFSGGIFPQSVPSPCSLDNHCSIMLDFPYPSGRDNVQHFPRRKLLCKLTLHLLLQLHGSYRWINFLVHQDMIEPCQAGRAQLLCED